MPKYIKSHSNYRLRTKHQDVKDGTVLERDISTVGGINTFATGQSTIYSSGNFIMTVNNSGGPSRHVTKKGWLPNSESGDTWNADVLRNYTSDVNGSKETNIVLRNDFMDLRSFACYGSLYGLIQTTVGQIIDTFPYELYTGTGSDNVMKHRLVTTVDGSSFDYKGNVNSEGYSVQKNFFELGDSGTPVTYVSFNENMYEVSNPGGIDIHTRIVDEKSVSNPLKHFANGGYLNYSLFLDTDDESPSDGYYFKWNSEPNSIDVYDNLEGDMLEIPKIGFTYPNFTLNIKEDVTIYNIFCFEKDHFLENANFKKGDTVYCRVVGDDIKFSSKYCPEVGDYIAKVTLTALLDDDDVETNITIYAFIGNDLNVSYVVPEENLFVHIRPRPSLCAYDDFVDNSTMFGKCLLGVFSGEKNKANFEVMHEGEMGVYKTSESFNLPIGPGGYNISSGGYDIERYIQSLAKIGLEYDEKYTDNMYRLMTHESLKNFDWTRNFNGNDDGMNNEYVENGEKFKSMIHILGYVFDNEKGFIDCISTTNTLTYDNRSNTPDYFITDLLENDGWEVTAIYPFELKEYDRKNGNEVHKSYWSDINQKSNYYDRKFHENTTDIIKPYGTDEGGFYMECDTMVKVPSYSGQAYYVKDGIVNNVIRNYHNDTEYTMPDVNNEFMKRLRINSRNILSKKGTIEGIESILSLFGLKSKRWYDSLDENTKNRYSKNLNNKKPFDFDITEYTLFTPPIKEGWDEMRSMYKIDFYNSCKTIPYNTQSYINGVYIPYQGIPVAYRDVSKLLIGKDGEIPNTSDNEKNAYKDENGNAVKARRLYPYFSNNGIYDGDMYYQMYGGWMRYKPYRFDINGKIVSEGYKETLRNIRQVDDLNDLVSQPSSDMYDGLIYYVNDISVNYAIINGEIYKMYDEFDGNKHYMYFNVEVYGATVSVGGEMIYGCINVSDRSENRKYDLSIYENGTQIKVYYTGDMEKPFTIQSSDTMADDNNDIPDIDMAVFIDGSLGGNTNYFRLESAEYCDKIGGYGWSQLSDDDGDYLMISGIVDKFDGNNPHIGNLAYDGGYEYVSRFSNLFKYASENELFDNSCFTDIEAAYEDINSIGFNGISDNSKKTYMEFLHKDRKVHSFMNLMHMDGNDTKYDTSSSEYISSINDYGFVKNIVGADGVTLQIVNTKVIDIDIYLSSSKEYSKEYQEEVKFMQDRVMPYLEQMMPPTAIVNVRFKSA